MFYLKLALSNVKKAFTNFTPFVLASTVMYVMSLVLVLISKSPSIHTMKGAATLSMLMNFGSYIITGFGLIILIYSYNYLLRKRSKEFGLYDVLGLSKGQITQVAFWELVFLFVLTLFLGSVIGSVFVKLLFLIFVNLISGSHFDLALPLAGFLETIRNYGISFVILFIIASRHIAKNSSLALLKTANKGEKEPQARLIFALVSLGLLVYGYYVAVSISNPLEAITRFGFAVIAVILGTFLFFMSFTIWLLKRQKAKTAYYYQPQNFIRISSMLYRMKANAVGLAGITVLIVMTLVTMTVTTGIFVGTKANLDKQYPASNLVVSKSVSSETMTQALAETGRASDIHVFSKGNNFMLSADSKADKLSFSESSAFSLSKVASFTLVNRDALVDAGNDLPVLNQDQVLVVSAIGPSLSAKTIDWYGDTLTVKGQVAELKNYPQDLSPVNSYILIMANAQAVQDAVSRYNSEYLHKADDNEDANVVTSVATFNSQPSEAKAIQAQLGEAYQVVDKQDATDEMMSLTGGFLFIGFAMSMTFVVGAALIIYYKQLSEGEEDKGSYKTLQDVGLSQSQIQKTIKSQVFTVFFLPLIVAIVHFGFAFFMASKLIGLFGVSDQSLIILVAVLVTLVIIGIYFAIYRVTSKTYYQIVTSK